MFSAIFIYTYIFVSIGKSVSPVSMSYTIFNFTYIFISTGINVSSVSA
jgi:hypothetical protein